MGNFINRLENYQVIPRDLIFDNTLSDRARFVFCFMASKPNGWDFYLEPMANEIGYSVDTLRKYINELVKSGWLTKGEQERKAGNRYGAVTYVLNEKIPTPKNSDTEIFGNGENPTQIKYRINNKKDIINKIDNKESIEEDKFFLSSELSISAKDISIDTKVFKKIDNLLSSVVFPFDDIEFKKKFFVLCCMPKWRTKTIHAIQMQLNKLKDYDLDFVIELIDNSIMNEWQGIVYQDTPKRYQEWLRMKSSGNRAGGIRPITDPVERDNMMKYLNKDSDLWK